MSKVDEYKPEPYNPTMDKVTTDQMVYEIYVDVRNFKARFENHNKERKEELKAIVQKVESWVYDILKFKEEMSEKIAMSKMGVVHSSEFEKIKDEYTKDRAIMMDKIHEIEVDFTSASGDNKKSIAVLSSIFSLIMSLVVSIFMLYWRKG